MPAPYCRKCYITAILINPNDRQSSWRCPNHIHHQLSCTGSADMWETTSGARCKPWSCPNSDGQVVSGYTTNCRHHYAQKTLKLR